MRQNIFMGQIWPVVPQFVTFALPVGADPLGFMFLSNWTLVIIELPRASKIEDGLQ